MRTGMDFENATPLAARRAGSAMPPASGHVARGVSLLPISQRSRDAQLATLGKNHVGMDVHANKQAYANGNPNCNASLLARIPPYPLICIDTFNTELRLRVTFESPSTNHTNLRLAQWPRLKILEYGKLNIRKNQITLKKDQNNT